MSTFFVFKFWSNVSRWAWPMPLALGLLLSVVGVRAEVAQKVIRIGFQKSGAFLLVKNEGTLEKRLAPLGWSVEWDEFAAGVPLLEALGAGRLDIGHSGDAPMIFAQEAGAPIVYLAASRSSPQSVALVVPRESALNSVKDLRGRRVIVGKGSSAHFFLVRALASAGVKFEDITPVYLNPSDARAAFENGSGEAWAVWDPFLASAEVKIGARVLCDGTGLTPFREFYIARKDFAEQHREIVKVVLAELESVGVRAKQDPKKIAAFLAPLLKIDLPTLEKAEVRKYRYGALPMAADIIAEQQNVADLFYSLHLVPKPVKVGELVWKDGI